MKKLFKIFLALVLILLTHVEFVQATNNQSFEGNDLVLTEDSAHTDTLHEAYEYYKTIANQLRFKDISSPTTTGMTEAEVDEIIRDDLTRETERYTDVTTGVHYIFTSDDQFLDNQLFKDSELAFIFINDELIGVSVYVRAFSLDPQSIYQWEDIDDYLHVGVPIDEFKLLEDSILAYGYLLDGGQAYNAFTYFTVDNNGEFFIENSIFSNDTLSGSRYYVYEGNNAYFLEKNLFDLLYFRNPDLYSDALDQFYNQTDSEDPLFEEDGVGRTGNKP